MHTYIQTVGGADEKEEVFYYHRMCSLTNVFSYRPLEELTKRRPSLDTAQQVMMLLCACSITSAGCGLGFRV